MGEAWVSYFSTVPATVEQHGKAVSEVSTSLVSAACPSLGPRPATHLQRLVPGHTIVFPFKARHLDQPISEVF